MNLIMELTPKKAMEIVLAKYPDAYYRRFKDDCFVHDSIHLKRTLGWGDSHFAAWADAARRIEQTHTLPSEQEKT